MKNESVSQPWLRSRTISLSRTEVILCAMVITVESEKCCLRVCWIKLSVAVSTDAVASSRTKTLLFLSSTLPRQTNCLWPILTILSNYSINFNVSNKFDIRFIIHLFSRRFQDKPLESSFPSFFLTSSPSWHLSKACVNRMSTSEHNTNCEERLQV